MDAYGTSKEKVFIICLVSFLWVDRKPGFVNPTLHTSIVVTQKELLVRECMPENLFEEPANAMEKHHPRTSLVE